MVSSGRLSVIGLPASVTLSRIVYLPGGSGRAAVDPNQTSDTIYFAPGTSQYNRKKDLKVLDPKMYGL